MFLENYIDLWNFGGVHWRAIGGRVSFITCPYRIEDFETMET